MEKSGEKYISKNYKKEDYLNIGLSDSSEKDDWEKAVVIFHERIYGVIYNKYGNVINIFN